MNIYTGLLFQQGYIQDASLAQTLAGVAPGAPRDRAFAAATQPSDRTSTDEPCKPFKRGAMAALCSIALSPFR